MLALQAQKDAEEQERLRQEQEMLKAMEEEERLEYLKRKEEEERLRAIAEEEARYVAHNIFGLFWCYSCRIHMHISNKLLLLRTRYTFILLISCFLLENVAHPNHDK